MPQSATQILSDLDLAQRRLGELFVRTRSHTHALEQMQACIDRYVRLGQPSGFILVGDSGTGKTRTLEELESWARQTYPQYADHERLFLRTDVPADCTPKALGGMLLAAAGDGFAGRSLTQNDREFRIRRMFDEVDSLAAVLDEAQNAFEAKTVNETKLICQALKNHWNICKRPMILAGMPVLLEKVPSHAELDQRFQNFAMLPVYNGADAGLLAEFRTVLKQIADIVPFGDSVDITNKVTGARLLVGCGGVLRRLRQLCVQACEVAESQGADRVELMHLSQGFRNLLRSKSGVPDPFVLDAKAVLEAAGFKSKN